MVQALIAPVKRQVNTAADRRAPGLTKPRTARARGRLRSTRQA
jgi:hypothetical protein